MTLRATRFRWGLPWILFPLLVATSSLADDWPQFLGPHANGVSDETGLLDKWPTNGLPLVWEKKIGTGYGAPSLRGELLVFHHRVGDDEIVEALESSTGKTVWKYSYPSHFIDPYGYNNGPRSSPLLTAERCYTFGAEGKLVCLELRTGKLVWQRDTAADWTIPPAFFGVGSSPILVENVREASLSPSDRQRTTVRGENGLLIVMVGGQPNSGVVALDPNTGKTVWESVGEKNWQGQPMLGWPGERKVNWQTWEKQASYSTPVVATIHGQRQLLCLTRQGLVSLNPTNGAVNFSFWFRSPVNDSVNAMVPVVVDDMILISGAYYKIGSVLLKVTPDAGTSDKVGRGVLTAPGRTDSSASGGVGVLPLLGERVGVWGTAISTNQNLNREGTVASAQPALSDSASVSGVPPLLGVRGTGISANQNLTREGTPRPTASTNGTSVETSLSSSDGERAGVRGFSLEEIWRSTVLELHWNTPIYYDGFLYAFSGRNEPDAHFRCVEFKTGKLIWDRDEHWAPHSTPTPDVYGRGSCILADRKLIVLGEGGLLGLFGLPLPNSSRRSEAKAEGEGRGEGEGAVRKSNGYDAADKPVAPEEISRYQVPQLHYPCWAAPILSNKRLYLRSEDRLVCLNIGKD